MAHTVKTTPLPSPSNPGLTTVVWWVLWFAMLNGLMVLYLVIGRKAAPAVPPVAEWTDFIGLGPLLISTLLRLAVMPRTVEKRRGLAIYIIGLSLAESCGLLGMLLAKSYTKQLVAFALLGMLQWAPVFARRFEVLSSGRVPGVSVQ